MDSASGFLLARPTVPEHLPMALKQSGIVRSDIRASFGGYGGTAEGVPMTLEPTVSDLANGGVAFEGVAVHVWHCTREGGSSLYSSGIEDQNYPRGVQVADADGLVRFTSIVPRPRWRAARRPRRHPADRRAAASAG